MPNLSRKLCNLISRNLWYLFAFILDFPSFIVERNSSIWGSSYHFHFTSQIQIFLMASFWEMAVQENTFGEQGHVKWSIQRKSVLRNPRTAKLILNQPDSDLSLALSPTFQLLPCECSFSPWLGVHAPLNYLPALPLSFPAPLCLAGPPPPSPKLTTQHRTALGSSRSGQISGRPHLLF